MSKSSKFIVWIVIAAIVVVGIILIINSNQSNQPAGTSAGISGNVSGQTSPTDTSDAALNQDLSSLDNQLNGLSSDSASINQSLNDQPVTQGQ